MIQDDVFSTFSARHYVRHYACAMSNKGLLPRCVAQSYMPSMRPFERLAEKTKPYVSWDTLLLPRPLARDNAFNNFIGVVCD